MEILILALRITAIIVLGAFIIMIIAVAFFRVKPDVIGNYYQDWEYGVFESSIGDYLLRERRLEKHIKTNEVLHEDSWITIARCKTKEDAMEKYKIRMDIKNETIERIK